MKASVATIVGVITAIAIIIGVIVNETRNESFKGDIKDMFTEFKRDIIGTLGEMKCDIKDGKSKMQAQAIKINTLETEHNVTEKLKIILRK